MPSVIADIADIADIKCTGKMQNVKKFAKVVDSQQHQQHRFTAVFVQKLLTGD